MSLQPKNEKPGRTRDKDAMNTLPPKPLTPEQEEKIQGGLRATADDRIAGN